MAQNASYLLMVRPTGFAFNEQTASTNAFQRSEGKQGPAQELALKEFNRMVRILRDNEINVFVIDDLIESHTPDSIFPNNWISTHEDGLVVVYPMHAENRRMERRADILEWLSEQFIMYDIVDLTDAEKKNKFLEGTGSMVLDRDIRICYACISPRTDKELLQEFCNKLGYELITFDARDDNNKPIFHTNMVMSIGEKFIVVCLDCIKNEDQRHAIVQSTYKEIISISLEQMNNFAGNVLEVLNGEGEHLLIMSSRAYETLLPEQITRLEKYARIVHVPVPTIEYTGGGGVRCMIAEIFLPKKRETN